jgi:hypothetical protein
VPEDIRMRDTGGITACRYNPDQARQTITRRGDEQTGSPFSCVTIWLFISPDTASQIKESD